MSHTAGSVGSSKVLRKKCKRLNSDVKTCTFAVLDQPQQNCRDLYDFLWHQGDGSGCQRLKNLKLKAVHVTYLPSFSLLSWDEVSCGGFESSCWAYVRREDVDSVRRHVWGGGVTKKKRRRRGPQCWYRWTALGGAMDWMNWGRMGFQRLCPALLSKGLIWRRFWGEPMIDLSLPPVPSPSYTFSPTELNPPLIEFSPPYNMAANSVCGTL